MGPSLVWVYVCLREHGRVNAWAWHACMHARTAPPTTYPSTLTPPTGGLPLATKFEPRDRHTLACFAARDGRTDLLARLHRQVSARPWVCQWGLRT